MRPTVSSFLRRTALLASTLALSPLAARADSVVARDEAGKETEYGGLRILRVEKGVLWARRGVGAGTETAYDVGRVVRVAVDDEPALTSAEQSLASGNVNAALDDYLRASRGTSLAWVRAWCSGRIATYAGPAGRWDAAVNAYIDLVRSDPELADRFRPNVSDKAIKPGQLDAIAARLDSVLAARTAALTTPQRVTVLKLALDVQRARNDSRAAARVLDQLASLGGVSAGDPELLRQAVSARLAEADAALAGRNPAEALRVLEANRALFTEPASQCRALLRIAEAKEAQLPSGTDEAALRARREVALAYLRVVAHFDGAAQPGTATGPQQPATLVPDVGAAKLKAAALLRQLGEAPAARQLYTEVAQGPDTPSKRPAADALRSFPPAP